MGLLAILIYTICVSLLCIFFTILFFLFQWRRYKKYFESRGIPFYESGLTNMLSFIRGEGGLIDLELKMFKESREKSLPLMGVYDATAPFIYVTDVELMKHIYVKDFEHFVNRRPLSVVDTDKFSKMLTAMQGDEWKGMRQKMSPSFTTGKIRRLFGLFDRSSVRMCDYLEKFVGNSGNEFDICQVYSKYAMDVIASSAFGIDSKCFEQPNPDQKSVFEEMGIKFQINFNAKTFFKLIFTSMFPKLGKALDIQTFDSESQNYFTNVIKAVIKRRKESGEREDDFLQMMIDAQEGLQKSEENSKEVFEVMTGSSSNSGESKSVFGTGSGNKFRIDDDQIIANCELFLLAGFDTLQSVIIFATLALAREQDIQERLFLEVEKCFEENGGKLTYEGIHQLSFLDLVINETMRYYAPTTRTERVCTKDYNVPGTKLVIEKGTVIVLPIYALHHDSKHYENEDKFDPERFLSERKAKRHPYSFVPFGHGPRNCIGMRFALTEAKTLICNMVHRFKIEPCSKTDIPPKFSNNPSLKPANGMWLKVQPRNPST